MDEILALKPDVMVTAKFSSTTLADIPRDLSNDKAVAESLARHWKLLNQAGIPVVGVTYSPRFPESVPDCVSTPGKSILDCSLDRATALSKFDHVLAAAQIFPQAIIADLNDFICETDRCNAVEGNVLVYRDAHHLTATYSRTLDSALGQFVQKAIKTEIGAIKPNSVPLEVDLPQDLLELIPDRVRYPGALTFISSERVDKNSRVIRPALDRLSRDFHPVFRNGCYGSAIGKELISCDLGAENGKRQIVVVGDNAAAMWLSALEPYAELRGFKITTFLKSGCPFTATTPIRKRMPNFDCVEWSDEVVESINRLRPDI